MNYAIKKRIKLLYTWLIKHKTESVAADLARQCRLTVTRQIVGESKILSPKQMRGYIRAYASCSLDSTIDKRDDIKRLNSSQISKVILQAKEYLIELVVSDVQLTPTFVADMAAAA